jgi:DnaK suppressor protein
MQPNRDLSPVELGELRELLQKSRDDIEASLFKNEADSKPVDLDLAIGRLSRVDALQQQQMATARRRRLEASMEQIRAALGRMAAGSYGECVGCGDFIGIARLRTRPEALRCLACQSDPSS